MNGIYKINKNKIQSLAKKNLKKILLIRNKKDYI